MKPIRLEMQAFGPFANKEVIDFALLGSSPFFMINGPTGAGKSSILDAICYALFNETTGSERSGDQMRCDFAAPDTTTYVTFEFELGSSQYLITRSPEQWLPKKRGTGLTKQVHKAVFYEIKDTQETLISNRPKDIEKEVQSRIGLNVKQFRQVMVIPQGKFRELLLASSKDREQILGQLFETHMYLDIEQKLVDKASGIRKQKAEFDQQMLGQLEVAGVADETELKTKIEETELVLSAKNELLTARQSEYEKIKADVLTNQALLERFQKLEQLQQQLLSLKSSGEFVEAKRKQHLLAIKANWIAQDYNDYLKLKERFESLGKEKQKTQLDFSGAKTKLADIQTALADLDIHRERLPEWRDNLYRLKVHKEQLEKVQQLTLSVNEQKRHLQTLKTDKEHLERRIICSQDEVKRLELNIEEQNRQKEQLSLWHHELKELLEYQTLYDEQKKREQSVKQLNQELESKNILAEQLKSDICHAENHALKSELNWIKNQAAELASHIHKNEPCPVCGSIDHPALAEFSGDVVTKEQVDATRQLWMDKQKQLSDLENVRTDIVRRLENDIERVSELKQKLSHIDSLSEVSHLTDLIKDKQQMIKQAEALDVTLLLNKVTELKTRVDSDTLLGTDKQIQIDSVQNQVITLEGKISAYQKDSQNTETLEQVHSQIQVQEQKIKNFETQYASVQEQREQAEKQCSVLDSAVKSQEKQYQELETNCSKALADWTQVLESSEFATTDEFLAGRLTEEKVTLLEQEIKHYDNQLLSLNTSISDLKLELAEQTMPDMTYWKTQLDSKQNEFKAANDDVMQVNAEKGRLEKVQEGIKTLKTKNAALEKEYQIFGTLSDVASGKNSARVSLHRFVLGVLLDDILIQASHRLNIMSQGRYLLYRKTDRNKGNASSGLELIVEDSYTGKSRDVATLSGGESFMAALALALGLSDVVQSYSGGIRLDTLFVDEGFGSLDTEALDLAIQVLLELQRSGRTIGIISHVNELKEQISCRIDVVPSTVGSQIKIIH